MNRTNYNWGVKESDNWCCNIDYNNEYQIVGPRKNIILKSAEKSQKKQKTSLKKRAGSNDTNKQQKKQTQNSEQLKQPLPHKQILLPKNIKLPEQPIFLQMSNHSQTQSQPQTINYIRYTPQKPHNPNIYSPPTIQIPQPASHQSNQSQLLSHPIPHHSFGLSRAPPSFPSSGQKKVNFIYNPNTKPHLLSQGVPDLQSFTTPNNPNIIPISFHANPNRPLPTPSLLQPQSTPHNNFCTAIKNQKPQHRINTTTTTTTAYQSQLRPQIGRSIFISQRLGSYEENGTTGRQRRDGEIDSPEVFSQRDRERRDTKDMLNMLSSRRETVLSVDGSESKDSIAIMDLQSLPFVKYPSIQTAKIIQQKHTKYGHSSLKSSINL